MITRFLTALLIVTAFASLNANAEPQGSTFTYQGELRFLDEPVTGTRDLTFKLFDAETGGGQIGPVVNAPGYPIADGIFTIDLDFGQAFAGQQRWLEVDVNGETLSPRQMVSAAPVALYALNSPGSTQRVLRWAKFIPHLRYDVGDMLGGHAHFFGGLTSTQWLGDNVLASQLSSSKEVLRTLFANKLHVGANALVYSDVKFTRSASSNSGTSADSHVLAALVRIRNTTSANVNWPVRLNATCFSNAPTSAAINGTSVFSSNSAACYNGSAFAFSIPVPGNRTSTVIFLARSGSARSVPNATLLIQRPLAMAFDNNTFTLPAGLELVDDLETATGGWEQ